VNGAVGTIVNDDTPPAILINNANITEGNAGTKVLTFTVSLSKASGKTISVNYATADGIARSTSDYVAKSGTLSFAPGSALTQTISITVNGDSMVEGDETLYVILSGAVNASIGRGRGVGTITNDDSSG
ncbi:MAG TPA: Calx-beta domain-containing protein, partial [Abditibacteriaceae bacterium]